MPTETTEQLERRTEAAKRSIRENEAALREKTMELEVMRAARDSGWEDPDRAWVLIDRDRLTIDDAGEVVGAVAEVERVAREAPGLAFNAGPGRGAGGTPPRDIGPRRGSSSGPRREDADAIDRAVGQLIAKGGYVRF